jgi:hemerythrin-like domain-containing protein
MLRDRSLVPLSRQHQHALALCVRINRAIEAGEGDVKAWREEISQIFGQEIRAHFDVEERELFPAAARFPELQLLVRELIDEHASLRNQFARASQGDLDLADLRRFAEQLTAHVRKEERQLFEQMQSLMKPEELAAIGAHLEKELDKACLLQSPETRLRPRQQ